MYLSDLLRKTIVNKSGEKIGKITDVIVAHLSSPVPQVTGFLVTRGLNNKIFFIPIADCEEFNHKINLCTDTINFSPYQRRENEVLLEKEVLDKQIVDVSERQLTRINDIELKHTNGNLYIGGVDVSFRSILNRLGIPTWGFILNYNSIPWEDIQFLGVDLPVKVKVDYDRLETLHPADIARFIFRGPGFRRGTQIIESLEGNIAADVIESLPLDVQVSIIENMTPKAAGRILSEMESHHSADVLSEFSQQKADEVMQFMLEHQAKSVRDLLEYPPGTAGSIMKVEYVHIPQNMTVSELYETLQTMSILPEFLMYFYVTESQTSRKLVGVVSLWELFKAHERDRLESIMIRNVVTSKPHESARRVLRRITQYDFSAIPVINKKQNIIGIVTLNDAIRLLIPKNWQTRIGLR